MRQFRITRSDVAIGAFFVFAAHLTVRFIHGVELSFASERDVVPFLVGSLATMALVHILGPRLLRLRSYYARYFSFPLSAFCAALGLLFFAVSRFVPLGPVFFVLGSVCIAAACSATSVLWLSTIDMSSPNARAFALPAALLVAVAIYFPFVIMTAVSDTLGDSAQAAIALVAIAALFPREDSEDERGVHPLMVLAVIAVACVLAGAVVSQVISPPVTNPDVRMRKIVVELMDCVVIAGACMALRRFAIGGMTGFKAALLFTATLFLPSMVMGAYEGLFATGTALDALVQELNIWVLVIVVFAFDARGSLYASDGVAVGVMFEALCFSQLLVCAIRLFGFTPASGAFFLACLLGYCLGVIRQTRAKEVLARELARNKAEGHNASDAQDSREVEDLHLSPEQSEPKSTPVLAYARENDLTEREAEVFELLLKGWDAKSIAGKFCLSYNTVRCHMRHIYEKLDIHSRKEMLSLAETLDSDQAT